MSSDVAISVRGLSKSYTIRHNHPRHTTLGEALVHRLKHPLERSEREEFWALDDLSFEVKRGEILGVIGRNGAGKSTLLKILSRITAPTKGEIDLYGRVGSLLEVGTGFHPELTGRENVYLNGSILGMRRKEISRRFDEIVDFSGVEQFLDTPVKRYSSGMYVRLAFAVAAHLDCEILLIDEVLAVGDAAFQERALGKIREVSSTAARTVLLVTHQLALVESTATRVAVLRAGSMDYLGEPRSGLALYTGNVVPRAGGAGGEMLGRILQQVHVSSGEQSAAVFMGGPLRIHVHGTSDRIERPIFGIRINSSSGIPVIGVTSRMAAAPITAVDGHWCMTFAIDSLPLVHGSYSVDVAVHDHMNTVLELVEAATSFEVLPADVFGSGLVPDADQSVVFVPAQFSVEPLLNKAVS